MARGHYANLTHATRHPEGSILLHGSSSSIYRLMPSLMAVATAPSIESGRLAFAQQLESRQAAVYCNCKLPHQHTPILSPNTLHQSLNTVQPHHQYTPILSPQTLHQTVRLWWCVVHQPTSTRRLTSRYTGLQGTSLLCDSPQMWHRYEFRCDICHN